MRRCASLLGSDGGFGSLLAAVAENTTTLPSPAALSMLQTVPYLHIAVLEAVVNFLISLNVRLPT